MHESTLRLIPEPALQTPEAGLQRPQTALLAFSPDMSGIWQFGKLLQGELEPQGILYDPSPEHVPNLYKRGSGNKHNFLTAKEAAELWPGSELADNLLKGMYWARLENKAPSPLSKEQAWAVGSAVGAAYNTQHGLWGEDNGYESEHTILMHSYLDGHDRLLVRGGDANLEFNKGTIDARSNRRPGIDTPVKVADRTAISGETEEFDVLASSNFAQRALSLGSRVAAAAASVHL
jgi:hypothetical protein